MKKENCVPLNWDFGTRQFAWVAMTFMALVVIGIPQYAKAEQGPVSTTAEAQQQSPSATAAYWTAERMRNAIPKELHVVTSNTAAPTQRSDSASQVRAVAGFAPGWRPGLEPQPDPKASFTLDDVQIQTSPPFSPPSSPTDSGNYSPFQRYNLPMRYILYPFSTIGKLFFTQNGSNFVCTASVIGRSTIATAGHCVHDGSGSTSGWSSNFMFCPSYNIQNGVNPLQGCWSWSSVSVSGGWFSSGNFDRDYACIVTSPTGTVHANRVGDNTGWTGRAWNWPSRQAIHAFGYPAAPPFPGNEIMVATSTEWYEVDSVPGDGQVSKYIGNDMTGGSSGGPWWMGVAHATREYSDTDGSDLTDPLQNLTGPFINGVNSHKRCNAPGCPSGSLFTQEMGSPQFRNTPGDVDESEDVFSVCLSRPQGAPKTSNLTGGSFAPVFSLSRNRFPARTIGVFSEH